MKKAQASLEFLSMYSWAITVIIILIGGITYFGVFDKSLFLKPYCSLTRELFCEDYGVYENAVVIELRNNFEKDMNISRMTLYDEQSATTVNCDLNASLGIVIPVGKKASLCCNFAGNVIPKGGKQKIAITLNYSRAAQGANIYAASGSVLATTGDVFACP